MNIGYACLAVGVRETEMHKCLLRNLDENTLTITIRHNLHALERLIDYNITNELKLFRISSDVIPFGMSQYNQLPWWELFATDFQRIADKIRRNQIRVSMHPGQYTVLNSPNEAVVCQAMEDLQYHARLLDCLGTAVSNKIVLHIGGVYGDKKTAVQRFNENYQRLSDSIRNRLVIENDDRSYNIRDVLQISSDLHIPVVYDNLHNTLNPADTAKDDHYWITACQQTWSLKDGKPKIHYAQAANGLKKSGAHSASIDLQTFFVFYQTIKTLDVDIMLEVKDKNLSALKCQNCLKTRPDSTALQLEWSRYKYQVLACSQSIYLEIREMLKQVDTDTARQFYHLILKAQQLPPDSGQQVNAAQHIWGYFKDIATSKEKQHFNKLINEYQNGRLKITSIRNYLFKLAKEYQVTYLLSSLYFYL
ncbi:MAG: UV DNA damage repair endonuclease UvsE [Erysipelotrichaceae bacterium]|nr:UV DNA damage repair endonuclease UvsE [Erysipelotrichaceae bacterium]